MSWLWTALLATAIGLVVAAEWPRLQRLVGVERRRTRERAKRKANLKLLRTESEEFAASVERDLESLPTIEENQRRGPPR